MSSRTAHTHQLQLQAVCPCPSPCPSPAEPRWFSGVCGQGWRHQQGIGQVAPARVGRGGQLSPAVPQHPACIGAQGWAAPPAPPASQACPAQVVYGQAANLAPELVTDYRSLGDMGVHLCETSWTVGLHHRCCPPLPARMQHRVSHPSAARHRGLAWSWPPWGTGAGGRLPAALCLLERTVRTCRPSCCLVEPHPGRLAPDSSWDTLSTCTRPSVPQTP